MQRAQFFAQASALRAEFRAWWLWVALAIMLAMGVTYVAAPTRYVGRADGVVIGARIDETNTGSYRRIQVALSDGSVVSARLPRSISTHRGERIELDQYQKIWLALPIDSYVWPPE